MSGYALSTISLQKNNAELLPVYAVIGAEKQQIGNMKQQQESWNSRSTKKCIFCQK